MNYQMGSLSLFNVSLKSRKDLALLLFFSKLSKNMGKHGMRLQILIPLRKTRFQFTSLFGKSDQYEV